MKDALDSPKFVNCDWSKNNRQMQLHVAFQALHEYSRRHGGVPRPRCTVCNVILITRYYRARIQITKFIANTAIIFANKSTETSSSCILSDDARLQILLPNVVASWRALDVFSGVCLFVCLFFLFINTITSERVNIGWWNLVGRCNVQKSRPSLNVGVIALLCAHPENVAFRYNVGKISAGCLVL